MRAAPESLDRRCGGLAVLGGFGRVSPAGSPGCGLVNVGAQVVAVTWLQVLLGDGAREAVTSIPWVEAAEPNGALRTPAWAEAAGVGGPDRQKSGKGSAD